MRFMQPLRFSPYIIWWELNPVSLLLTCYKAKSAKGNNVTQFTPHLTIGFSEPWNLSTRPLSLGKYGVVSTLSIPNNLQKSLMMFPINCEPWFETIYKRKPVFVKMFVRASPTSLAENLISMAMCRATWMPNTGKWLDIYYLPRFLAGPTIVAYWTIVIPYLTLNGLYHVIPYHLFIMCHSGFYMCVVRRTAQRCCQIILQVQMLMDMLLVLLPLLRLLLQPSPPRPHCICSTQASTVLACGPRALVRAGRNTIRLSLNHLTEIQVFSLSPEYAAEVRDLLLKPPTDNPYSTLKTQLTRSTTASE